MMLLSFPKSFFKCIYDMTKEPKLTININSTGGVIA